MSFGLEVDLEELSERFRQLAQANDERRMLEDGFLDPPVMRVRRDCPECGAGFSSLTTLDVDGALMRACRRCRHIFDLE
jgi:hypothetical protein